MILEEPEVPEEYNKYSVDGINVYLYKEALVKEGSIEIKLAEYASDLPNKDFDIFGLEI